MKQAIQNDTAIQQLSADCLAAEKELAEVMNDASDFVVAASADEDEGGTLSRDSVESNLRERLENIQAATALARRRKYIARVAEANENEVIVAIARRARIAMLKIYELTTYEFLISAAVATAAKGENFSMASVAVLLEERLSEFAQTLKEMEEYRPVCGTGCYGCAKFQEGGCADGVTWANSIPSHPECFKK